MTPRFLSLLDWPHDKPITKDMLADTEVAFLAMLFHASISRVGSRIAGFPTDWPMGF
jgi:hypothetical protein